MGFTVFYSWQDDSPRKHNRYFIKKAIKLALSEISAEGEVEDSPRLDEGMEGVSGTPEVANVIFGKIKKCSSLLPTRPLWVLYPAQSRTRSQKETRTLMFSWKWGMPQRRSVGRG
jgi:hypothetical protein